MNDSNTNPGVQDKQAPTEGVPAAAFRVSARAYRRAMGAHDLPEPAWRVLDKIVFYGVERGEFQALIPQARMFADLCGLSKGQVSEALDWLRRANVLLAEKFDPGKGRRWDVYTVRPPAEWRVPLRVAESSAGQELEGWLERVRMDQPELIEPPASLDALLCEGFVEGTGAGPDGPGRVEPSSTAVSLRSLPPARAQAAANGPCGPPVVEKVPPFGTLSAGRKFSGTELSREKVQSGGTLSGVPMYTRRGARRIESSRIVESRSTDRSRDRLGESEAPGGGGPSDAEFRGYVEERLFRVIGRAEREGTMGGVWLSAIDHCPERVNELIGVVEAMQREGTLRTTPVRWLNTAVRAELRP